MKYEEKAELFFNNYYSINLNKYIPNQNNILPKSPPNNFNFNKINPLYNGKIQQSNQNIRNFSAPKYLNQKINNSTVNLNKLNVVNNNQTNINIYSPKYNPMSLFPLNSNNSNYFSPLPQKSNILPNNTNLDNFKLNNKKKVKYISSPLLDLDKKKENIKNKKKTLVLDLDETLVHSGFNKFNRKSDIVLNINIDGRNHTIYVLKRPYVDQFLKEISKYFEVFIFTASISQYATPLLDKLDKEKIFNGRLFREHCIYNSGLYLKDLNQIGKDLKDVIIIDNNPASYALNQENGIPILTWYDNLNDNELIKLIPLLKYLANVDDVRTVIKEIVNREINKINFDLINNLINNDKNQNKKINGGINNTNLPLFNNKNTININKFEVKKGNNENKKNIININSINLDKNKLDNNINNGNNNIYINQNELFKYNEAIDSMSNMTYDEIQNEGHFYDNNNKENVINNNSNNINCNNIKKNNITNKSILKRTKDLFNGIDNENNSNENGKKSTIFNYKNEKRSFTPNINIKRKNNYYNKEKILFDNNNKEEINNIINKIQNSIKKVNEIHENITKFNSNISKEIILNGNNITKINNYLSKNDENNDINFLNGKTNKGKNKKIFNDKKQNLILENKENKNINSKRNSNYFLNSINNRNNPLKEIRIGFNYNTLNNNSLNSTKRKINSNELNNSQNIFNKENININSNKLDSNNYINNSKNINKERADNIPNGLINNNEKIIKEEKQKSIIELRREKLNEIKRKMEEINKDLMKTDNQFYHTQNNFMAKNNNKTNNNLEENKTINNNIKNNNLKYQDDNENNFEKNNIISKYKNNDNNFSKSYSSNKNIISKSNGFQSNIPYFINENEDDYNIVYLRTISMNEDIDLINYKNQRADTEINTNTNNYNIEYIMNNEEIDKNARNLIINKKLNKYNNEENNFNNTYSNGFKNYVKNLNDENLFGNNEKKIKKCESGHINNNGISPIKKIHNNMNINSLNIYNSLSNENKDKFETLNKNINHMKIINRVNNYNGNNKMIMNKSSSNFYPRIFFELKEEKNKKENNTIKQNINIGHIYQNDNSNDIRENKFMKKSSMNYYEKDNDILRKISGDNYYNF